MTARTVLLVLAAVLAVSAENTRLKEVFSWQTVEFKFPKDSDRADAIKSGDFIPENNLPLGLDVWRDKLFITVPRWKAGVVSSLNYVDISGVKPAKVSKTSPALIPYPNLDTNTPAKDKDCITSVFRVRVDPCDRLWVMDTGVADILGKFTIYSKPQILIYDLLTDKLIKKYVFEDKDTQENSFFANIVVDVEKDKCDEAFAYVPDLGSYGIVVYDMKKDKAWRIKHHYFHFDPLEGDYNVGGVNFQWTDGVFGIALTRPNPDGSKTAYFHALSSTSLFKVQTAVLQDEGESKSSNYTAYTLVGNKGPKSQTSASFIHESTGVMFYTQVNKDAVYCWNTDKPFSQENLEEVASDSTTMVFPNDLKVDYKNNLWVLTDKLPVFVTQGLDSKDVNYRIFVSPVAEAIKDTNCVP